MNLTGKGRRNELKARKLLESQGWQVIKAKRSSKWDEEIDFFGLFDLCAYKDGYFRWIQCKSNYCPKWVRENIRDFLTDGLFVTKEVWVFKDNDRNNPYITKL